MKQHPKLSVIIPFFNEEECLQGVSLEAREVLMSLVPQDWQLIMVDDGSNDGTAEIVDRLASTPAELKRPSENGIYKGLDFKL